MKHERGQMVQRPFNFAIVDEVDSILIDEARTPLIISGPTDDKSDLYMAVDAVVKRLSESDYEKDEKTKNISLTEDGFENVERILEDEGLLVGSNLHDIENTQVVHHLDQALKAVVMFKRDIDYIVKDGKVVIIDEFTGRMMEGTPLVERSASGGRGQGRRADRAGKPDHGLDHLPELFPHVSQAFGHDRNRRDRSVGILRHLQDERRLHPHQRAGEARGRGGRVLQEHHRQVPGHRQADPREERDSASRSSSAPFRSRRASCCRTSSTRKASNTTSSTPASTSRRRISSPRPDVPVLSPSPPTWPDAAPTSSLAAMSISASRPSSRTWSRGPNATGRGANPGGGRCRREAEGARCRGPLRDRHRAAREPPHRQPASAAAPVARAIRA
jgi:hypothetical protein